MKPRPRCQNEEAGSVIRGRSKRKRMETECSTGGDDHGVFATAKSKHFRTHQRSACTNDETQAITTRVFTQPDYSRYLRLHNEMRTTAAMRVARVSRSLRLKAPVTSGASKMSITSAVLPDDEIGCMHSISCRAKRTDSHGGHGVNLRGEVEIASVVEGNPSDRAGESAVGELQVELRLAKMDAPSLRMEISATSETTEFNSADLKINRMDGCSSRSNRDHSHDGHGVNLSEQRGIFGAVEPHTVDCADARAAGKPRVARATRASRSLRLEMPVTSGLSKCAPDNASHDQMELRGHRRDLDMQSGEPVGGGAVSPNQAVFAAVGQANHDNRAYSLRTPLSRRANNRYKGALFVSPPILTPTPDRRVIPSISAAMKFLGLPPDEKRFFFQKHLPPNSLRATPAFWVLSSSEEPGNAYKRTVVSKLALRLLQCVAETICGVEAATDFLNLFFSWLNPESGSNDELLTTSAEVLTKTRPGSLERRSIRAVLCGAYSLQNLREINIDVEGFSIDRRAYSSGRRDLEVLLDEGALDVTKYTKQKFDVAVVDKAVRYILSVDNVAFLSWGTKMVKLDGDRIIVPAIQRRKSVSLMFEQYKTKLNSEPTVTRRSFYRLAGVLTHGTTQLRTAVNYVTGFLVNDTFELLGRIARDLLPDSSETVVQRMDLLREWLKYGGEYVDEGGDTLDKDHCPRHAIQFGLAEPGKPCSNVSSTSIAHYKPTASCELNEEERHVSCSACAAMDILLDDFSINLEKAAPDPSTFEVVRDAYEKMELYLGHRVRVSNQQRALQDIADDIKADCIANKCSSEAIVIIDYKMKMEPLYYREKTVDHCGKRGLSLHGALIRYWSFDPASGDAHETKVYLDQIANGDNKQDKEAVVALVEGILMSIHLAFPFIKKVTFQSDNASCYQNTFVAVILPLLGSVHGIEVVRYVHSETQDGKCILDAHFATAMRKIKGWVRQGHTCTTPTEVVTALNADGGMPNFLAELVDYDRVKMDVLGSQVGPVAKALSKIISRFNDVVYDHSGFIDCSQWQQSFDIQSWPPFKMSIFEYSGVGDGLSISVEPSRGLCSNSNTQPTTQATEPVQIEVEDGNADGTTDEALFDEAGQCDSVYSSDSDTEDGNLVFETDFAENNHDRLDSSDTLLPSRSTGVITGISISRSSCIKLRTRSTRIPRTRLFATNMNYSERDIKSYAKRCLLDMQSGGDFHDIVQASDVTTKLIGVANECNQRARTIKTLSCGWARRPKKGFMYGAKYIGHYKEKIEELFNRGEVDPSKKLTPARMLEHLTKTYPRRYNLPGENEIRTRISTIMQNRRKLLKSKQTKPTSASNPKQNE